MFYFWTNSPHICTILEHSFRILPTCPGFKINLLTWIVQEKKFDQQVLKNLSLARSSTTWPIHFFYPFFDGTHSLFFGKIKFVPILISHELKKEKFEIRALFYYPIKTLYEIAFTCLANHKSLFKSWVIGSDDLNLFYSEERKILKSSILPFPISDEMKWFFSTGKDLKIDWLVSCTARMHADISSNNFKLTLFRKIN